MYISLTVSNSFIRLHMASIVADMSSRPVPYPFFMAVPIILIPVWQSEDMSILRVCDWLPCFREAHGYFGVYVYG